MKAVCNVYVPKLVMDTTHWLIMFWGLLSRIIPYPLDASSISQSFLSHYPERCLDSELAARGWRGVWEAYMYEANGAREGQPNFESLGSDFTSAHVCI
jgi:hypothetical protein